MNTIDYILSHNGIGEDGKSWNPPDATEWIEYSNMRECKYYKIPGWWYGGSDITVYGSRVKYYTKRPLSEWILRFDLNLPNAPRCPICGDPVKYMHDCNSYSIACSANHAHKISNSYQEVRILRSRQLSARNLQSWKDQEYRKLMHDKVSAQHKDWKYSAWIAYTSYLGKYPDEQCYLYKCLDDNRVKVGITVNPERRGKMLGANYIDLTILKEGRSGDIAKLELAMKVLRNTDSEYYNSDEEVMTTLSDALNIINIDEFIKLF
jgi:hypothetical protein